MIIKASQRGGARQLSRHLLNANDNEHVRVHEVSGFLTGNLSGALNEAYVISKGTQCKQFLFSVSLSPPPDQEVPIEVFEDAAKRIEERMNVTGQPRVFVFHEKEGRRHAHVVWSRIDPEQMKAINLPYFKNQLMEVSKEIYLEQGWNLPTGFINRENRNPLNFTRDEWQQAKRLGDDPKTVKLVLRECWSITEDKQQFIKALEMNGYYLAQGDRRGHVAVDWRGEVYSLSRQLEVKTEDLKTRLGDATQLPSVDDTKAKIDVQLAARMKAHLEELNVLHEKKARPLMIEREKMQAKHKEAREALGLEQAKRWKEENEARQARYRKGIGGLLDRVTGRVQHIRKENEQEAYQSIKREREERDRLALSQIRERALMQCAVKLQKQEFEKERRNLQQAVFSNVPPERISALQRVFQHNSIKRSHRHGPSM